MKRVWLILPLALLLGVAGQRIYHARKAAAAARIRQCNLNLRLLGTAMKWYAIDNDGFPPATLKQLVPIYTKNVPDCDCQTYQCEVVAKSYTLTCQSGHGDYPLPPHYPYASSVRGLVVQP
ncbi:hypothetical protein IV102_19020 [bacterium]|nr:hypothetical protein [bacterium]